MNVKGFIIFWALSVVIVFVIAYFFLIHPIAEEIGKKGIKNVIESIWYGNKNLPVK